MYRHLSVAAPVAWDHVPLRQSILAILRAPNGHGSHRRLNFGHCRSSLIFLALFLLFKKKKNPG